VVPSIGRDKGRWTDSAQGWPAFTPGFAARAVVAVAILFCVAFVVLTQLHELHLYADGGMMSYAVAVQDSWRFLWRNMSGRLLVYVVAYAPASALIDMTGNPAHGVRLYAFLFSVAPALGLAMTWLLDRTPDRLVFLYACLSTVLLCPLVFGFPTEMWFTHAMVWPVLALSLNPPRRWYGRIGMAAAVLALLETHEAAVGLGLIAAVVAIAFGCSAAPDGRLVRARLAWPPFVVAFAVWLAIKIKLPPDEIMAETLARNARRLLDLWDVIDTPITLQLAVGLGAFIALCALARALRLRRGFVLAAGAVLLGLLVYWVGFDTALHAEQRYHIRLIFAAGMAALTVFAALHAQLHRRGPGWEVIARLRGALLPPALRLQAMRFGAFAAVLLTLISSYEVVKFCRAWDRYADAVRQLVLAGGPPPEGQPPPAVSTEFIPADLQRLAWHSTAPFLSVLLVPGYRAPRYAVDPEAAYFPLTCALSLSNVERALAFPAETRLMLHAYNCRFG